MLSPQPLRRNKMDKILLGVLIGLSMFDIAMLSLLIAIISTAQLDINETKTPDLHVKSTAQNE